MAGALVSLMGLVALLLLAIRWGADQGSAETLQGAA